LLSAEILPYLAFSDNFILEIMDICSVGRALKKDCHIDTFVERIGINNVSEHDREIWALRTGIQSTEITDICCHHQAEFDTYYSSRRLKCYNIFKKHKKVISSKLHIISLDLNRRDSRLIP